MENISNSIVTSLHHGKCGFEEFKFGYPLKFIAPPSLNHSTILSNASVYILSYGGGLVSGDYVKANFVVGKGTCLTCLTQGSTKVFKQRMGQSVNATGPARQEFDYVLEENAGLIVLPEAVTPFANSNFVQLQKVKLAGNTSSLILLDWYTSGRYETGEAWKFESYQSTVEISSDKLLIKEVVKLNDLFSPFQVFATLYIVGPHFLEIRQHVQQVFSQLVHGKSMMEDENHQVLWSTSNMPHEYPGIVVKATARETQHVRQLICKLLQGLEQVVGENLFARIV